MGKMSLRDIAILLAVVVLALYGLAAVLWFMTFERDWAKSAKAYDAAVKTYRKESNLIARRDELQQQYQEEEEKILEISRQLREMTAKEEAFEK